jgi:hypothetical protein
MTMFPATAVEWALFFGVVTLTHASQSNRRPTPNRRWSARVSTILKAGTPLVPVALICTERPPVRDRGCQFRCAPTT